VAQLTQKTNQFNLTTIRYTESEIASLAQSPDAAIFRLRPADRFGDYGISGVLIARRDGATGIVDTLLMSCRILERRLELAFVSAVLKTLEARWQLTEWRAEFRPTEKNKIVMNFWESLGFGMVTGLDGHKSYTCSPGQWRVPQRVDFIQLT
jgi:FkbH-like protein